MRLHLKQLHQKCHHQNCHPQKSEDLITLKIQARKGALYDEYEIKVMPSNDPIHGSKPSTLRLSSACGHQVICEDLEFDGVTIVVNIDKID